jgi:hypothetical protein
LQKKKKKEKRKKKKEKRWIKGSGKAARNKRNIAPVGVLLAKRGKGGEVAHERIRQSSP